MERTIHLAAMNEQCETVEFLLSVGVDINERDDKGKQPLDFVWDASFAEWIKRLGARKSNC